MSALLVRRISYFFGGERASPSRRLAQNRAANVYLLLHVALLRPGYAICMLLTRSTFYWLWFTLFGVIPVTVAFIHAAPVYLETLWLLVAGGVGLLLDTDALAPRWSRPCDAVVGVIFSVAGWLGILHNLGINIVNNTTFLSVSFFNEERFLGLSLALSPALLHTALGFLALKYALRNPTAISSLEVNTVEKK